MQSLSCARMIYLPHLASEHQSFLFRWVLQPGDGTSDDFALPSPFCFLPRSRVLSLASNSIPGFSLQQQAVQKIRGVGDRRKKGEATQRARKENLKPSWLLFLDIYFLLLPFLFGVQTIAGTENFWAQTSPKKVNFKIQHRVKQL